MRHTLVCLSLVGLFASYAQPLQEAPTTKATDAVAATIHIVKEGVSQEDNWYEDRFHHAHGAQVGVARKVDASGAVTIDVDSIEGRRTSGQAISLTLSRNEQGHTVGVVKGTWWYDFGGTAESRRGALTDVVADIYLARELGEEVGLRVRFVVTAKIKDKPVLLMGGVTVPLTK